MKKTCMFLILALVALVAMMPGLALGSGLVFRADASPDQEVAVPDPDSVSIENAEVVVCFSEDLSSADVRLEVEPSTNVVAAHFHCNRAGQNGPVAFGLLSPGAFVFDGDVAEGTLTGEDFTGSDCMPAIGRPVNNIAALAFAMRDGLIYLNVHTEANGPGEVRGQLLPGYAGDCAAPDDADDDEDDESHGDEDVDEDADHPRWWRGR